MNHDEEKAKLAIIPGSEYTTFGCVSGLSGLTCAKAGEPGDRTYDI